MVKELPHQESGRSKTVDPGKRQRMKHSERRVKASDYSSTGYPRENALPNLGSMRGGYASGGKQRPPQSKVKLAKHLSAGFSVNAATNQARRERLTVPIEKRFATETLLFAIQL